MVALPICLSLTAIKVPRRTPNQQLAVVLCKADVCGAGQPVILVGQMGAG